MDKYEEKNCQWINVRKNNYEEKEIDKVWFPPPPVKGLVSGQVGDKCEREIYL